MQDGSRKQFPPEFMCTLEIVNGIDVDSALRVIATSNLLMRMIQNFWCKRSIHERTNNNETEFDM